MIGLSKVFWVDSHGTSALYGAVRKNYKCKRLRVESSEERDKESLMMNVGGSESDLSQILAKLSLGKHTKVN